VSQGRELVLINPVVPGREACHADPNRARPPLPGAPVAGDVFAHSEYAVGRAGCTGARLVGKVKDHCVLGEWFEIAARMTRCPPQWSVRGRPCLWNRGLLPRWSPTSSACCSSDFPHCTVPEILVWASDIVANAIRLRHIGMVLNRIDTSWQKTSGRSIAPPRMGGWPPRRKVSNSA